MKNYEKKVFLPRWKDGDVIIYIGAGFLYFQVEVQIELLKIIITAANAG